MSPDGEAKHQSFAAKLELPFPLLVDDGSKIAKAFGVTRLGGMLPSRRVTFVIGQDGRVRRAISAELDIGAHVRDALGALRD